jgi:hypothetical protein
MLFTWDSKNLCIIFKSWHVRGTASLIFSLLAIVAICIGYEALREATRRYETWVNKRQETAPREFLLFSKPVFPQTHIAPFALPIANMIFVCYIREFLALCPWRWLRFISQFAPDKSHHRRSRRRRTCY